jgi:hypothetical protein
MSCFIEFVSVSGFGQRQHSLNHRLDFPGIDTRNRRALQVQPAAMNLPEQLRRPSAHHAFWLLLPRAGRQSKRESLDGIEHNAHVMHDILKSCLLIINWFVHSQLPQKRLSSGRRCPDHIRSLPFRELDCEAPHASGCTVDQRLLAFFQSSSIE